VVLVTADDREALGIEALGGRGRHSSGFGDRDGGGGGFGSDRRSGGFS
jgi:hypothetical protein